MKYRIRPFFHALADRRAAARRTLAALLLLPLSLGGALAAADTAPLRLAVSRGPVSLALYVAEARGFFDREGVAVQLLDCASGRSCFAQLADGRADLATAAELLVTLQGTMAAAGGRPDAAIIATISTSARHIKLVASRSSGIATVADLPNKRVATVAGTSAAYFLHSALLFHDIDPRRVTLQSAAPDQLAGLLQRHEADAIAIWEPEAAAAARALGSDAIVLATPNVYTQHFSLIAGRRALDARAAELVRLLRALQHAERFIADRPDEARQILAARLQQAVPAGGLAEHDFRLAIDQSLIATIEAQSRWATRRAAEGGDGAAPSKEAAAVNLMHLIDPTPLRQAVPGAVVLVR